MLCESAKGEFQEQQSDPFSVHHLHWGGYNTRGNLLRWVSAGQNCSGTVVCTTLQRAHKCSGVSGSTPSAPSALPPKNIKGEADYGILLLFLSHPKPLLVEWRLQPEVVQGIWDHFGKAEVDLFASRELTHCPLSFSLAGKSSPLGHDTLAQDWPSILLYVFPPLSVILPALLRVLQPAEETMSWWPHFGQPGQGFLCCTGSVAARQFGSCLWRDKVQMSATLL